MFRFLIVFLISIGLAQASYTPIPSMTAAQRVALVSPQTGLTVFDTTLGMNATYDGTNWNFGLSNLGLDNVYSATMSAAGVISNENKDWINGNCSTGTGATCTFNTGIFTVTPNCGCNYENGGSTTSASCSIVSYSGTTSISLESYYANSRNLGKLQIWCMKQGIDYANASSNVYSQASSNFSERNDGVITIGATTTGPTKGTTSIDRMITSRYGNRAKIVYSYRQAAGGTAGSGEYLFSLPSGLSFDSSIIPDATATLYSSDAKNAAFVGVGQAGGTNNGMCSLFAYSTTQFRAICANNAAGTPPGFNTISSTYDTLAGAMFYSFTVDAPISGWSNASQIVGSFAGYAKVPGASTSNNPNIDHIRANYGTSNATTSCTASPCSYLDQVGSGAISSVTRGSTGNYTPNFARTYSKLKCIFNGYSQAVGQYIAGIPPVSCANCNSLSFTTVNLGAAAVDTYGIIDCIGEY